MKKTIFKLSLYIYSLIYAGGTQAAITNPAEGIFVDFGAKNTFKDLAFFAVQNILLPVVGIIAVLFIIIGGFQLITARGNEEQAEAGKKTLTNAIIGLSIVILSYVIVVVVINALKGSV